ncbi:hypothetical protein GEMRC1_009386 [Eukaryota sp. GEM-RC1]
MLICPTTFSFKLSSKASSCLVSIQVTLTDNNQASPNHKPLLLSSFLVDKTVSVIDLNDEIFLPLPPFLHPSSKLVFSVTAVSSFLTEDLIGSVSLNLFNNNSLNFGHHLLSLSGSSILFSPISFSLSSPHCLCSLVLVLKESKSGNVVIPVESQINSTIFHGNPLTSLNVLLEKSGITSHTNLSVDESNRLIEIINQRLKTPLDFDLPISDLELIWKSRRSKILINSHHGLSLLLSSFSFNDSWKFEEVLRLLENSWSFVPFESLFLTLGQFSLYFDFNNSISVDSQAKFEIFVSKRPFIHHYCKLLITIIFSKLCLHLKEETVPSWVNLKTILPTLIFQFPLIWYFEGDCEDHVLIGTLIELTKGDFRYFSQLYWLLRTEEKRFFNRNFYDLAVYLKKVRRLLIKHFKNSEVSKLFTQRDFIRIIQQYSSSIKQKTAQSSPKTPLTSEDQHSLFLTRIESFLSKNNVYFPFHNFKFKHLTSDGIEAKVKIFSSAQKPILLALNQNIGVIFKIGDDLRNDHFCLSLIELMTSFLQSSGSFRSKNPLISYSVIPTGHLEGIIEVIPNIKPMSSIPEISSFFPTIQT